MSGTIPTEVGLLTKLSQYLCARPLSPTHAVRHTAKHHCATSRARRDQCVLNAPCEKERCTAVRASKVYHPMALKTCAE